MAVHEKAKHQAFSAKLSKFCKMHTPRLDSLADGQVVCKLKDGNA